MGAKTAYGAPQFRVLHWVKAPRGSGTVWCDVPDPLPGLPQPYSNALEKLFGVKPAVKPAAGMSQLLIICTNITALQYHCSVQCKRLFLPYLFKQHMTHCSTANAHDEAPIS